MIENLPLRNMTDVKSTPMEAGFHTFFQEVYFFCLSQCQKVLMTTFINENTNFCAFMFRDRECFVFYAFFAI